jgi:hypothetical protein
MLENEKRVETDSQKRPNINIWVRKNRQFRKDVKITVEPNESYSAFTEVNDKGAPAPAPEKEEEKPEENELF